MVEYEDEVDFSRSEISTMTITDVNGVRYVQKDQQVTENGIVTAVGGEKQWYRLNKENGKYRKCDPPTPDI